jgi:hypothetical protein
VNEKAFRLDFFIAIAALLVSALTAGALVYQTRVIADQYAATIWPYLSVNGTFGPTGGTLALENDGLGPALIESAQLSVDGKVVPTWNDLLQVLVYEPEIQAAVIHAAKTNKLVISSGSIGPSSTIRPGERRQLVSISYDVYVHPSVLSRHRIALDFCYCSLNRSCWTLHSVPSTTVRPDASVQTTARCTTAASIASVATSLSVHRHKK